MNKSRAGLAGLATGTWMHNSGYSLEPDNSFQQGSVSRLNAAIRSDSSGDRYFVKLWANNITNEPVIDYSSTSGDGTRNVTYEAPRIHGITVGYRVQ